MSHNHLMKSAAQLFRVSAAINRSYKTRQNMTLLNPIDAHEDGGFVPLWRRIENSLREAITSGRYPPGSQIPPDRQIAETFGANRLTVRRALAALEQSGLIRAEHGIGTFVEEMVKYNLGERVRFNQNLRARNAEPSRRVLRTKKVPATARVAAQLRVEPDAPLIRFDLVGLANGRPIACGSKYCPFERFPTIAEVFKKEQSFTAAFMSFGVADYRREYTNVVGRFATPIEARLLKQAKSSIVLGFESVDADLEGRPVSFQEGCYSAERVMFVFEGDKFEGRRDSLAEKGSLSFG